jgi:hypothetical protein
MGSTNGLRRIRLREAPRWVRAWLTVHRAAGMMLGIHFLPEPRKWLERHGYVDKWPW